MLCLRFRGNEGQLRYIRGSFMGEFEEGITTQIPLLRRSPTKVRTALGWNVPEYGFLGVNYDS